MTKRNTTTAPPRNTTTTEHVNTCVDNIPNRRARLVEHRCSCGRTVAIVASAHAWCTVCGRRMTPAEGPQDAR